MTSVLLIFAVLATGTVFAMQGISGGNEQLASVATVTEVVVSALPAGVAIVGDESLGGASQPGNSWPGEVISYGNIPVQPAREGTIVDWRVKIGEHVGAGQVLARLSAPPAMPELVAMLAEQAEGKARMRAQAETTKKFAEANNEQLRALLDATATNTNESQLIQARAAAVAMGRNLRTMLEQTLVKHMSIISNVSGISYFRYGSLNRSYGAIDPQNQNQYELQFMKLAEALKDQEALPVDLATGYFAMFARLANTSSGEGVTDINDMAREDQEKFFDMLADYRDAQAEITMKQADNSMAYATDKREVEEKISENEKMVAMAEAETLAADASYATVERSISGGLAIVAPRAGVVSTINKKVGDFVEPGMPVASIDTEKASERFVRLQIPSNARVPKAGDILSAVRPGFAQDVRKVKLTGVGTSLDTTGGYMADASFVTPVDWPVAASVRVFVPKESSTPLIKLTAVWWSSTGVPHVWGVSEAGRLFARKITLGRTLGASVEVYEGLSNGDRYVVEPTGDMQENMLLQNKVETEGTAGESTQSGGDEPMGGMEM